MSLSTTETILEREQELEVLRAAVDRAADREGGVVLVTGEAGIGKSALLRTWLEDEDRARVLVGWCDDFLTGRTLGPFHDVARRAGGEVAAAVAAADTGAVQDALLSLLDDPLRPVVVVLEDVHWADEATLDVVRYVGRRIVDLGALLVLTYRDDEIGPDHPLTSVAAALGPALSARITLRPLSVRAVAQLVEGHGRDPEAVLTATAGNPFYVTELLRLREDALPATVADAVLARVGTLPGPTRAAVDLLSVIPRPPDTALLGRLLDDPGVLTPAERRGLLVVESDGRVRFRHELARLAVEHAQPTSQRRIHHEVVLRRLLEMPDLDTSAVLNHAAAIDAAEVIVDIGPGAATAAMRAGAHGQAVAIQEQVLRHADLLEPPQRARLLEEHAWALYSRHRFPDALRCAVEAVALRRALDDPGHLSRSLCTLSRMHFVNNEPDAALAAARAAVDHSSRTRDPEVAAEAGVVSASTKALLGDVVQAEAEALELLPTVRDLGRRDLESLALNYASLHLSWQGSHEQAIALLTEAVRIAKAERHWEPAARAYGNLVWAVALAPRPRDEVSRVLDEAIAFTSDHDFTAQRHTLLAMRAQQLLQQGRWDEAETGLVGLLEATTDHGVIGNMALEPLARVRLRRGAPDAEELVARTWELALTTGSDQFLLPAATLRVEQAYLGGQHGAVEDIAVRAAATGDGWASHAWSRHELWVYLRRAGMDIDVPTTDPDQGPWAALLRGDWREAAHLWEERGDRYERALALVDSGEEAALLEALVVFDELGARPAATLVRRRLRERGVRSVPRGPQRATRRNPAGLTPRQLDVLELVVEGLTNAEIADELVLSVRTVDHHVSAILAKLGVGSRVEAAAAAEELLDGDDVPIG